ncbi:3-oxoacyl-[acyl-carrier-protein] reductase [Serpentinicella sp. ANB-PHB4]|uniref:3-oxoacyl-[acyl-carrier-protein] reductase n=1 Tax=Serpentinicella sp. ANB-PHB4 TaxID=3074076 RepID=UPI00285F9754|nr:3-oxoacyl-[acyl-carrier-protein] reductase [Serpentinicella sp. ANB-PHB4]MDR5659923.1 3-oxoacyl-[acyl-carrier-protein] reductase [Serpentinicella sp. ANB-PHB4]
MRLQGKVAFITGSTRGLGRAIAERYAEEGATVVINDRSAESVDAVVAELKEKFPNVAGFAMDVTDRKGVEDTFNKIVEQFGTIDILVNNAGITADAQLYKMTEEQWDNVMNVNLKGVFYCSQEALKVMREKQYGKIINISSVVGLYGNFGQVNYAATKFGVIGMTKSMAKEVGRKNINVNAVAPGFIATEMTAKMPEKVLTMMADKAPLGKIGEPVDIANACLYLASDESKFVTGTTLSVDGGVVL